MEELNIKVHKSVLLLRLKKHKTRFVKSYAALLQAYRKKAEKFQKDFALYVAKVANKKDTKKTRRPYPPEKPVDYTKD